MRASLPATVFPFPLPLPPSRPIQPSTKPLQFATADLASGPGLVADYQTVNSAATNFVFRGDSTYFINGTVSLFGTTTIEGSSVLKFSNNLPSAWCELALQGPLNCKTGPYRPAVFTSCSDDSVGETIMGSSGLPAAGVNTIGIEALVPAPAALSRATSHTPSVPPTL